MVPFAGESCGREQGGGGELSWGQQEIWLAMRHQRSSLPLGVAMPLPEGTTVDSVAADLRFVVGRHQALRTTLLLRPDGPPRQRVATSGEVPLEVIDAGDDDPARVAQATYQRYMDTLFDYAHEFPIRYAVVTSHGAVTHQASVMCHLATDGLGIMAMARDADARDPRTGAASGPVTALTPIDQARLQRTTAERRKSHAALRYWEATLRAIPAHRFKAPPAPLVPRYGQVLADLPDVGLAARLLAARTGAGSSAVMLAAFAVALARVTGESLVVTQVVISNRFRPGFADTVSPVNQAGLCVIDVADVTFAQAVRRASMASMKAAKNAYYDPLAQRELIGRVNRERGEPIDISCFFNDRRLFPGDSDPTPTAQEVRAARERATRARGYQRDLPSERLFFNISDAGGRPDYEVCFDTKYVSADTAAALLREFEEVIVSAATSPAATSPADGDDAGGRLSRDRLAANGPARDATVGRVAR